VYGAAKWNVDGRLRRIVDEVRANRSGEFDIRRDGECQAPTITDFGQALRELSPDISRRLVMAEDNACMVDRQAVDGFP